MAISKVQATPPEYLSGDTPLTVSFGETPTEGNLLIVWLRAGNSTAGISSASVATGYTLAASGVMGSTNGFISIWYKVAGASESTEVVATVTGAGSGALSMAVEEWSGLSSPVLDKTAYVDDTGSTVTSRSSGTTAETTADEELVVAGVGYGNTTSAQSWSNGFTDELSLDTTPFALASYIASSAATFETTLSWTTARRAAGCIATFMSSATEVSVTGLIGKLSAAISRLFSAGRELTGSFRFSGIISTATDAFRTIAGSFYFTGVLAFLKKSPVALEGLIGELSGVISRIFLGIRALDGSFRLIGDLSTSSIVKRTLSGLLGQLSGVVSVSFLFARGKMSGTLARKFMGKRVIEGILGFSGIVSFLKYISGLTGLISEWTGDIARKFHARRSLDGLLNFTGSLSMPSIYSRSLAGTLRFSGVLTTEKLMEIMYYGVANP